MGGWEGRPWGSGKVGWGVARWERDERMGEG